MGNSSSTSEQKGRKIVEAKIASSLKTGVLNLSDQDLKATSSVWVKISVGEFPTKLRVLTINNNELKVLPVDITNLFNLRKLHASKCSIQRIPNISNLNLLTVLELDNNDLESNVLVEGLLPNSLTNIDLSYNHLNNFPLSLNNLNNLIELNLANNRLTSIDGIGSLTSLLDLCLDDNLLTHLPNEINLLINLKVLSLKRNKLKYKIDNTNNQSIPKELLTNSNIDRIDLEGNIELTKELVLSWNGIESYLERKRLNRIKKSNSGAIVDQSLFGLD